MEWLNDYRIRLFLVGFVAAVVLGGGNAKADFTFGEVTCVDEFINSGTDVQGCSFLHDGLKLYFTNNMSGPKGIWLSSREAQDAPWGEPVDLGPNVNSGGESYPAISPDELELYFHPSWNSTGLMRSTRASKDKPWGPAKTYTDLGDARYLDFAPDGLTVYFSSGRPGGYGGVDIWAATRTTVDAPWGEPVNLGPNVNTGGGEYGPSISNDGLVLFFYTDDMRIYMTRRATKDDTWGPAVELGPSINGHGWVASPEISPDGSALYFDSNASRPGGYHGENIWQVPILPIVDLNGDGIIDSADMCIMVDHWGTDNSLCDIGPMPWGDGIVDVQDMVVFAEHLFDKALPVDLVAHWKLDETEGYITLDSAGDNDAFVFGGPVWQPSGGMMDGAIELDGIDDCAMTGAIQILTNEPFRVFAWVKSDITDGIPGQVILSQMGGVSWLCTDPTEGNLMTELRSAGQDGCSLISETIITDGDWHRIGLAWDGSKRTLYVDDVVVAEDTQDSLTSSTNTLYIGTGSTMQPGTYWAGLIDDVRIYVPTTGL